MSEQIKVERIEIKIGKKVLNLTPEEMKELRDVLDKTLPKGKTVYIPGQPIIIEKPAYPWHRPYPHWEPTWISTAQPKKIVEYEKGPTWRSNSVLHLECKSAS